MQIDFYQNRKANELTYVVLQTVYKEQLVLVKHKERRTWEIPGGHIEEGETPYQAAVRELVEETGALKFNIRKLCDYSVTVTEGDNKGFKDYGRMYFCEIEELGELGDSEIGEVKLFDALPANLTYEKIQPKLYKKTKEILGSREKGVDLHIHSYVSDGHWSGKEVVEKVKEMNIRTFAVCDHDDIGCVSELVEAVKGQDLVYVKGVEISVSHEGREHHVLSYFLDENNETLKEILNHNLKLRIDNNKLLAKFLEDKGYDVSYDEYETYDYNPYTGGWKMYGYLRDKGLIEQIGDYFKLVKDFPYKIKFKSPEEVIPLLIEAGITPILAHPPAYAEGDLYPIEKMDYWRKLGIAGFECYTQYLEDLDHAKYYVDYCRKYGLKITGGSDCHGDFAGRRLGYPDVREYMVTLFD